MCTEIFQFGFWVGLFSELALGFTLNQARASRAQMNARNRPLDTFHDAGQSDLTARQIFRQSRRVGFLFVFWILMLAVELLIIAMLFDQFSNYFLPFC
jgi:hypothetical protein